MTNADAIAQELPSTVPSRTMTFSGLRSVLVQMEKEHRECEGNAFNGSFYEIIQKVMVQIERPFVLSHLRYINDVVLYTEIHIENQSIPLEIRDQILLINQYLIDESIDHSGFLRAIRNLLSENLIEGSVKEVKPGVIQFSGVTPSDMLQIVGIITHAIHKLKSLKVRFENFTIYVDSPDWGPLFVPETIQRLDKWLSAIVDESTNRPDVIYHGDLIFDPLDSSFIGYHRLNLNPEVNFFIKIREDGFSIHMFTGTEIHGCLDNQQEFYNDLINNPGGQWVYLQTVRYMPRFQVCPGGDVLKIFEVVVSDDDASVTASYGHVGEEKQPVICESIFPDEDFDEDDI